MDNDVKEIIGMAMEVAGMSQSPENEINILRMLIKYGQMDLDEKTSPNPELLKSNIVKFKRRLDELNAGEIRA
jgi:hypothetical protein